MPSCPFCQTTISEDLSLYGGHCPSCLIEIPGEEAVTDPGVPFEVTDSLAEAKGSGGAILSAAVAGLVVLSAVAGWWSVQGDGDRPPTETQAADVRPVSFSVHEDADYEEPVEEEIEEPSTAERVVTQRVTSRGQPPPVDMAPADASVVPTKKAAGLGSASDGVFGSIGAAPRSRAPASIILEDSLKIEEMIGRVLNRGAKQLEQCYNKALKLDSSVKGAWYVDFTIVKEGKPVAVSVEPLEAPHTEIEACIYRAVERWRFQRITEPVDVARRYRFGG